MTNIITAHQRFCLFSKHIKGNTPKTILWHQDSLASLLNYGAISSNIEEISSKDIEDWIIYGRTEKRWATKTILGRMDSLSLFFEWGIRENIIKTNPMKDIPRPKLRKKVRPFLDKDEANLLLRYTRNYPFATDFEAIRASAIMCMFLGTGMRKEELRNLELNDVNLPERTVFIRAGKGEKDRIVAFKYDLTETFQTFLKKRKELGRICPFFFVSLRQDVQMGAGAVKRLFHKLRKGSGIYFSAHILRHTFATLMLQSGCDLFTVKEMLGHENIQTTCGYLRAVVGHLQMEINRHPVDFL